MFVNGKQGASARGFTVVFVEMIANSRFQQRQRIFILLLKQTPTG